MIVVRFMKRIVILKAIFLLLLSTFSLNVYAQVKEQKERPSSEEVNRTFASKDNFQEAKNNISSNSSKRSESKQSKQETLVLKGSVEKLVPSGTPIKLKLTSMPMRGEVYLDYWDVNNEFIPPQKGDRIISELTEPIFIEGELVIPKRTKFYGFVSNVVEPKRFGKDGSIEVSFEGLETPAGKFLKFAEQPNSLKKKEYTSKQKIARGIVRTGSYAVGGVVSGALVATQAAGLFLSSAQPAYVLMTGGGVGLLVGMVASVIKKGRPGRLMPGDEIQVNLEKSLLLPVAEPLSEQKSETFQVRGLNLEIKEKKLVKDDFGRPILIVGLRLTNMTNRVFHGNDFFLLAPYNRVIRAGGLSLLTNERNPVFSDGFASQRINPGEEFRGQIAFEIDFPGFEHFLCLNERRNQFLVYKSSVGFPKDYLEKKKLQILKKKIFGDNSDPWD